MTTDATALTTRFVNFVRRRAVYNLARLARQRNHHTTYIAITGSSAKSTTCSLLAHILKPVGQISSRIFDNTMPTIAPFMHRLAADRDFAVIETGIEGPDRMIHLAKLIRPHIAIVTMIAMEHKSSLRSLDIVAAEKGILIENLPLQGIALLNSDDEMTESMAERATGQVVTFGRENPADYRAVAVSANLPETLSLQINGPDIQLDLQTQMVGEHFWLPVTAAVACACHLGVSRDTIIRQVASFVTPFGRCTPMQLPDNRLMVLDTGKAPQHSLGLAFEMVRSASAVHKRIVLGQLSDTTGSSQTAYRKTYSLAREAADEVIFVGQHAHRHNASADDIANGRIREFRDVREVADYLRDTAVAGELILLKSSANLHLERAALAQTETVNCWERNCGIRSECPVCEFYKSPRQQSNTDQPV